MRFTPTSDSPDQDSDGSDGGPASCDSSDCSLCHCHGRMRCSQLPSVCVYAAEPLVGGAQRSMLAHGIVGRKRSFQQAVNTDVEHGRSSSSPEGRPGSDGRTPLHVHPLRGSKRSLVGTAQVAMHRSAGSSTELTALDAEGSLTSTASAGAACEPASPDAGHDSEVVGQQQESPGDGQDPLGTLPLPLPCGALCQLPCSQQSSATAAPDELKFPGYEGEHRPQQASSCLQCAAQASDDLTLIGRGRGGTDALSDRAGPELREVAAFQHPSAAGGHADKGRRAHSDIVCDVQFSAGGDLIATAGVGKQIRVYGLSDAVRGGGAKPAPIAAHRLSAKLSSLAWSPALAGVITAGDYDGSVVQVNIETGHWLADADEHNGRRVWSVAHSALQPNLTASGADDGIVRLWHDRALRGGSTALVPAGGAAVCGVEFCDEDSNLLAVACADSCSYVYDLRNSTEPLYKAVGHSRAVSYARFQGRGELVTASVDATVRRWRLGSQFATADGILSSFMEYRGHQNTKNFVGLSVHGAAQQVSGAGEPLIACGSEDGVAHVYGSSSTSHALATWRLDAATARDGTAAGDCLSVAPRRQQEFISSVCWQPAQAAVGWSRAPLLAVASSDGDLRVLKLQ